MLRVKKAILTTKFIPACLASLEESVIGKKSRESKEVETMMNEQIQIIHVPTTNKMAVTKIDLKQMSEKDITSLKRDDPFMYHSIPSIYSSTLNLKKRGASEITSPSSSIVSRKTRLSTECDVLLDDELLEYSMMLQEFQVPEDLIELFGGVMQNSRSK